MSRTGTSGESRGAEPAGESKARGQSRATVGKPGGWAAAGKREGKGRVSRSE